MGRIGIVLAAAALASSAAWAQQAPGQKSGTERPRGVVTGSTTDGGIALHSDAAKSGASAVSGGVSVNARDNLRSQVPPHNIKMVFSLNTGNYVSDVQVKVTDKSGKVVLDEFSNGPWLYAKLPAGSYSAAATYNGSTVKQNFSVTKSGARTAQFRWPASVEQNVGAAAGAEGSGQILGTGPQEPQR